MNRYSPLGRSIETIICGYILSALRADDIYSFVDLPGLTCAGLYVCERDALIIVTSDPKTPAHSSMTMAANAWRADVMLICIHSVQGAEVVASVDLAAAAWPNDHWVERDLSIWDDGKEVWLVPAALGPCISVSEEGLRLELLPPYSTLAERNEGVRRAGRTIASLAEPAEGR